MRSEFQFIQNIKKKFRLDMIGDDCAVIPAGTGSDTLLTTDLLVEDIDFHLEWTTPELLGHKALAVSLSDVAAMGGEAKWALLSLAVPESLWGGKFVDQFYDGYQAIARKFAVELIGGDISRSPDKLVIDSMVMGEAPRGEAILRSTAQPGNLLLVTGSLGGAAGGLELLRQGLRLTSGIEAWQRELILKQLQPWPQVGNGLLLQMDGLASAMIDISDGLSSDLAHICRESDVGAVVYREKVPLHPAPESMVGGVDVWDLALHGGEDFELLFCAPAGRITSLDEELFTVIGEITDRTGIVELVSDGGATVLEPRGFSHF